MKFRTEIQQGESKNTTGIEVPPSVIEQLGAGKRPAVKVTTGGQVLSGTLESISDFHVTFVDAAGIRRTISRDNDVPRVEVNDPAAAHLELLGKYTDQDMWNLTAYLVTLK